MRGDDGSGEHIGFFSNARHGLIPGSTIVPVGAGDGDAGAVGTIVGKAVGPTPVLDGLGDGGTGVSDAGGADGPEPVSVAVGAADGPGAGRDFAHDEIANDAPEKMSSATRIERKLFTLWAPSNTTRERRESVDH